MDLFATQRNSKCTYFVFWILDPDSSYDDAFIINWNKIYFYNFPPFVIVSEVFDKIISNKAADITMPFSTTVLTN